MSVPSMPGAPEQALVEFLKTIDTPTLSNAIELLDVRPRSAGFAPHTIRCLYPELGVMTGFAVTVQFETITRMGELDKVRTLEFYEAIAAGPKPSVVVAQEVGGFAEFAAHCGEVMATLMQNFGCIGFVSDSAVRDFDEVRRLRFHYFAQGTVASHGYCRVVQVGVPVQVRGLVVKPGDLVHGDVNGLIQVPAQRREELPGMVERVRQEEKALMEEVRAGGFTIGRLRERLTGYR